MALSTVTVTWDESKTDVTERHKIFWGTVAVSAAPGTYATGGNTISLAGFPVSAYSIPLEVRIWSVAAPAALYLYKYVNGTTTANGLLQIFTGAAAQSGLAELAAGATPAGVSGDTIQIRAEFVKE